MSILYPIILIPQSCLGEGDEYIVKEWEVKAARTRKLAQCIQTSILQELCQSLEADAMLPEGATKDLVLQVIN